MPWDITTTLSFLFFIVGTVIGSFLNVVIFRFNTARSLGGRSACTSCLHKLSWYELIPLLSFLCLSGRCKNCKTRLSPIYPLVELLTGAIFLGLFLKFQDIFFISTVEFLLTYKYYALMFSFLLVVAFYDLRHRIIPDLFSFGFAALAFLGLFFYGPGAPYFDPHLPNTLQFFSGIFLALPFALLWFVSGGKWMGLGDAKLALGLGWFLGIPLALSATVLAFWIGALIAISLVIFSPRYGMKSQIPFAPYLVLGALIAFIFNLNFFVLSFL